MEIADIFVVNKADREGADRTAASIEAMLSLETFGRAASGGRRSCGPRRRPGRGVPSCVDDDRAVPRATRRRRSASAAARAPSGALRELLGAPLHAARRAHVLAPGEFDALLDRIAAREIDPYTAADGIVDA